MSTSSISGLGKLIGQPLWGSVRDLLPIVVVVAFFQIAVFRQPLDNWGELLVGTGLVIIGLTLFITGLELGLFPLGEGMAHEFARKGSIPWLIAFAFALGFGTTFAEPALIAIAEEAAYLRVSIVPDGDLESARSSFAFLLRSTVAVSVGLALVIGVIRIVTGWPLHFIIIAGYIVVMLLTVITPKEMVAVAYDSGGITTSTITVPLTAALGIGLASSIRDRNPLLDGFGLIALASLTPILFVLLLGIFTGIGESTELASTPPAQIQEIAVAESGTVAQRLVDSLLSTAWDILPIAIVITFFQVAVLRRRIAKLSVRLWGFGFVIFGLSFFLIGLQLALFPLGRSMAEQLTGGSVLGLQFGESLSETTNLEWYRYYWTYLFALAIGASTAIAEPSLIAVAMKAEEVSGGAVQAWGLRMAVALGVGIGVALGALRIVTGTPLPYYILGGYAIVIVQTYFAPKMIIPIAYDSGGVATSTVTVPLVAALGLGLATHIPDRDPIIDGFGMIAIAVLTPIISVMAYAQIATWRNRSSNQSTEAQSE